MRSDDEVDDSASELEAEAGASRTARSDWPRSAPLGHARTIEALWRAAEARRLPHALLFHGPRGVGKFAAAQWLALGLYCARGIPAAGGAPCLVCGPCKRVLSGNHADVFVIDPLADGHESIPLGRFVPRPPPDRHENAQEFLDLRAAEGGWRTLLVREMERARDTNTAAQNAILKMLEEPGEGVLWILESSRPGALAATIRSRCVSVRFAPLARAEVEAVLATRGVGAEDAATLARWSRGSPGDALASSRKGGLALRTLLVATLAGERSPLEAARAAWEVEGDFDGDKPPKQARDRARFVVSLAVAMARDLLRLQAGASPEELAHGDLAALGAKSRLLASSLLLARGIDGLVRAREDLDLNLDPAAVLERAFLAFAGRELAPRRARARAALPGRTGTP